MCMFARKHGSRRTPWVVFGPMLMAVGCARTDANSNGNVKPTAARSAVAAPVQWFTDVTQASGLRFVHESGAEGNFLTTEITGPGCALFDYDNDGDLDAYLINGNWSFSSAAHPDEPTNTLLRQESDGRFTDVTGASGLGDTGYGMGVALGDIDNDGDLDVLVTNVGPNHLYRNNGDGTFADITDAAGVRTDGWSASAAFLDYDRDGWLDLYITRYLDFNPVKRCFDKAGRPDYCAPNQFPPVFALARDRRRLPLATCKAQARHQVFLRGRAPSDRAG